MNGSSRRDASSSAVSSSGAVQHTVAHEAQMTAGSTAQVNLHQLSTEFVHHKQDLKAAIPSLLALYHIYIYALVHLHLGVLHWLDVLFQRY